MGARSTNLIFVEKSNFWVRNVPIAGNQISQSICNELQEPFMAAETLKKGKGFVSLGGVYADPEDADAARISKLIRTTMTRLHVDINRSIAYYRTTLSGTAPKRVFLTGGSSQLPYLDLFIADKLSLPVAYFNPLRNVNLGPNINTAQLQNTNCYTGGAGRPGAAPRRQLPGRGHARGAHARRPRRQEAQAALLLRRARRLDPPLRLPRSFLLAGRSRSRSRPPDSCAARRFLYKSAGPADHQALQAERPLCSRRSTSVVRLGQQRNAWPELLDALNNKIPEGVWITQLTPAYDAKRDTGGETPRGGRPRPWRWTPEPRTDSRRPPRVALTPALGGFAAPTDQINILVINGLYHVNAKTPPVVDPNSLRDFVQPLSAAAALRHRSRRRRPSCSPTRRSEADAGASFAENFSLHLPLKQPIELTP